MDKLDDLFRGFRSGVTAPSEDAISAARELLHGEIGSSERMRSSRTTRRGLVAVAVVILVGGLLVTPALGIGSRLLDLIESPHGLPGVQSPVWSPGGGRIAFLSRGERSKEVYVVNADGSGQRRLTGDARFPASPAWSPNGRQLVFEGGPYVRGVYVVNADGSGQRRLARSGGAPAWSPDGRTIAFFSDAKIYLMNADGSEHRQLTGKLWVWGGAGRALAWSPDGRKLAFFGKGDRCPFCFSLYVVNSDGSGLRNLTGKLWVAGAGSGGGPTFDPAWSPDGQMIAFVGRPGLGEPIYVVRADGSGLRNLTPKPVGTYAAPAWSPDGRKLAFVSDRDGNSEVYVMNANGEGQRSLTRNPAYDADPAWSHDGRKIAFVSNRDGSYGIYVMNADGSGQRPLAQRSP
jgi:Tol biopolymer transport system component